MVPTRRTAVPASLPAGFDTDVLIVGAGPTRPDARRGAGRRAACAPP